MHYDLSKLNEVMSKIKEIELLLSKMVDGQETTVRTILEIEFYTSKSGNPTWKAIDENGDIIYLRQSHREMLVEIGWWNYLNDMNQGSTYAVMATIETVKDGDFHKMVKASELKLNNFGND